MLVINNNVSKINIMRYVITDGKSCGFCVYPPAATFGPRKTIDYEIVWLESGTAVWKCNNESYKVSSDSVLITKPGGVEFFEWDCRTQTGHYFIHFNIDTANAPAGEVFKEPQRWPVVQVLPQNNILRPMLMHALWLIRNGYKDTDPLLQGILTQIIITFVSGVFEVEKILPDDLPPAIERVFDYIYKKWETFPMAKTDLSELAGQAHVSATHLCRIFNDTFQMSPIHVLKLVRLKRAAGLLVRTNYPVQEVSQHTGFESPYHFSRSFKETYGISPTTYRRRSLTGERLPLAPTIVKRF